MGGYRIPYIYVKRILFLPRVMWAKLCLEFAVRGRGLGVCSVCACELFGFAVGGYLEAHGT